MHPAIHPLTRLTEFLADCAVTKAEDPEKILEQAVTDMQGDLIKMRQASAQVAVSWGSTPSLCATQPFALELSRAGPLC